MRKTPCSASRLISQQNTVKHSRKKDIALQNLRKSLRHASIWFLWDDMGREIWWAWGHVVLSMMRSRPVSLRLTFELLRNFMVWKAFLTRYHLRHYVAYNDTIASDTARNILLHQAFTETWYYLHTCANTDIYTPPGEEDLQDVEFSYLHFAHLVAWGEKSAKFYRSVPNFIGSYEIYRLLVVRGSRQGSGTGIAKYLSRSCNNKVYISGRIPPGTDHRGL